jgi:hypothetical protein
MLAEGERSDMSSGDVIRAAREALVGAKVENKKGMNGVEHSVFKHDGQDWSVCRVAQIPGAARAIDVAVSLRGELERTVMFLRPPLVTGKHTKLPKEQYLTRYQAATATGLGITFVLDGSFDGKTDFFQPATRQPWNEFRAISDAVHSRIEADKKEWIPIEDSREAEGLVRVAVHRALHEHGFERAMRTPEAPARGKGYQAFWRRGEADGVWERASGMPRRIALDVKHHEDADAPLCQVLDNLGHADAVIAVRVTGTPVKYDVPSRRAMVLLEERLAVRYLEIEHAMADPPGDA